MRGLDLAVAPNNIDNVRLKLKRLAGRPREHDRDRARLVHPASAVADRRRHDLPARPARNEESGIRLIPGKEELRRSVGLLEERGWHLDGDLMEMSPAFAAFLNLGEWSVRAVPDEVKEQAASNAGMLTVSATGLCKS
ncbi:hypothetical protein ACWEKM_37740 [Streptomyces sp. NPDC004752]